MDVVVLKDGSKIEIDEETSVPPAYSTVADEALHDARVEFKLSLFGQLPRKRRLKLRGKEIEMSSHPENAW